jgi:hypothetical protein
MPANNGNSSAKPLTVNATTCGDTLNGEAGMGTRSRGKARPQAGAATLIRCGIISFLRRTEHSWRSISKDRPSSLLSPFVTDERALALDRIWEMDMNANTQAARSRHGRSQASTQCHRWAIAVGTGLLTCLLAACGGGDASEEGHRQPLAVTAAAAPAYDREDLYRFFAIAFGAAPGVTYMSQLVEAADSGLSVKQIVNIFTTKPQFLETYPASLTHQEYAQKLVDNVVGSSATAAAKAEAVADIIAALSPPANWTRGDITYAIFNNLAKKPANDANWAGTAQKMAKQVAYAKHYTDTMKGATIDLTELRAVVKTVTESSSVNGAELSTLIQNALQAALAQSRNLAPLALALADRPAVQAGVTVLLDGRRSFDFEGRAITYAWKLDSRPTGSTAVLSSLSAAQPSFVADVPGQYVATLVVNDGVSTSRPSSALVTALPAGALTNGQTAVASLNTTACTALNGCTANVLSNFVLTVNQCTITKVGPTVTLSRPGLAPIAADFDGDVTDRASISGKYLVIGMRGRLATDQLNIEIDKDTGVVAAATGTATVAGVTRTIDCTVVTTNNFPATAAVPAIASVADLFKAFDPRECRGIANGAMFSSCPSSAVPDFSIPVGTCTLAKSGETLTVSKPGLNPISAKFNGELLDGVGESFNAAGGSLGYISFAASDTDPASGSQQSITLRIVQTTMVASIFANDFRKSSSNTFTC